MELKLHWFIHNKDCISLLVADLKCRSDFITKKRKGDSKAEGFLVAIENVTVTAVKFLIEPDAVMCSTTESEGERGYHVV